MRLKLIILTAILVVTIPFITACATSTALNEEAMREEIAEAVVSHENSEENSSEEQSSEAQLEEEKIFTLEELAKFNGENGQKSYIAVDGIVYDVTDSSSWKGPHQGKYPAGKDYTEEIKNISPHGVKVLEKLPIVGKLE